MANANAAQKKRVALVIGNSAYSDGAELANPINDAKAIAKTVGRYGFEVITAFDATQDEMLTKAEEFSKKLDTNTVAFFYFAGHGIEVKNINYLIPIDINLKKTNESRIGSDSIGLDWLLGLIKDSGAVQSIIVLDACRDNPLASSGRSLGKSRGLKKVVRQEILPQSYIISYATGYGNTAEDGEPGSNGLYTRYLLQAIKTPGLDILHVFNKAKNSVAEATNLKQIPATYDNFLGSFYFDPSQKLQSGYVSDKDALYWESIKDSDNKQDFKDYINKFRKKGTFYKLAKARIKAFEAKEKEAKRLKSSKAVRLVVTSPKHSVLTILGSVKKPPLNIDGSKKKFIMLEKGRTKFQIELSDGETVYGVFNVLEVPKKTTNFGRKKDKPTFRLSHIDAALEGSPVEYVYKKETDQGVRDILMYELSAYPL